MSYILNPSPKKDAHYASFAKPQQQQKQLYKSDYNSNNSNANTTGNSTIKKSHPLSTSNYQQQYSPSPYINNSNSKNNSQQPIEQSQQRINELEQQLAVQSQELQILRVTQTKGSELEKRVDDVATNNNQLQVQLDRANKQLQQRKAETDLWKQKYETQVQQLVSVKSNYELEIHQLSIELQKLHAHLDNMETEQNRKLSDQMGILETQTRSILGTAIEYSINHNELHDQKVDHLRSSLQDKILITSQLETALERQKSENTSTQLRLNGDIDQLKKHISNLELDHQQELNNLKQKLDLYKETEIRNVSQAYNNEACIQLDEIFKLKNLLEIKNEEIATLIEQANKSKQAFEQFINSQKQEIGDLNKNILQIEQAHQQANHNLTQNLEKMHNTELMNTKFQSENQISILNQDIQKYREIINEKNTQIELLQLEKNQQKDFYDSEMDRYQSNLVEHRRKVAQIEGEKLREVQDLLMRIDRLNEQNRERDQEVQQQMDLLNKELNNVKALSQHKQNEIEGNLLKNSQMKNQYEDQIRLLNNDIDLIKLKAYDNEKSKYQEIQDLKQQIQQIETQAREKQKQLEVELQHIKYELGKQKDMYNHKTKECENLHLQKQMIETQIKKLCDENDRLIQKLQSSEKEKNNAIDDIRSRLDIGASYQFENIKKAYNTQIGILSEQIDDLQNKLDQKQQDYSDLLGKYMILDRSYHPESLVKENMYNSKVGVPPEFIANKSAHDALLKSNLRNSSIKRQ